MTLGLNGFSVNIIGPVRHFKKNDHNYYSLPNFSEYKIRLTNHRPTRTDAEVFIDGISVGTWRIGPFNSIVVERPANLNRRFVFVEQISKVVEDAGLDINCNSGLITVIFKPEKINICRFAKSPYISTPTFYDDSDTSYADINDDGVYYHSNGSINEMVTTDNTTSYNYGATILGKGTDQHFNLADQLTLIDYHNITRINLRLIASKHKLYLSVKDAMKGNPSDNLIYQLNDRMFNNDRILIEKPYTDY